MFIAKTSLTIVLFVICSFSVYSKSDDKHSKAVYLVAQISVKDYQEYMNKYGKPVTQLLIDAGAEILVASRKGEILEGEWSGNWTVITKFPSNQAAMNWYNSTEYRLFKTTREDELMNSGNIIILPSIN